MLERGVPRTESIETTAEVPSLIAGIGEFEGSWRALGTLAAPERLSALRRVASIESVGPSTRIENGRTAAKDSHR